MLTMKEALQYQIDKKKLQVAEWSKVIEMAGECTGITQMEFEEISKVNKVKGCTHRSHSRGNLWSFRNTNDRETFKR